MTTFSNMLEWALRRHGERTALVYEGREMSYAELGERSRRLAAGLAALGVNKGDRVLIAVGNRPEFFEAELAVAWLAAIKVPVLPASPDGEIARIIRATTPTAAIITPRAADAVLEGCATHAPSTAVLLMDEARAGSVPYEDALKDALPFNRRDVVAEDLYAIRFTGGTTGLPKGVTMDQRSMANVMNTVLLNWALDDEDVSLLFHPLTHGCGFVAYALLLRGAKNVILPDFGFSPRAFVESVERYGVTSMFMIPTVLNILLDSHELEDADVSSVRWIMYGGAPIAQARLREGLRIFGAAFAQMYGSSESPMLLTTLLPEDHAFDGDAPPKRLRSAGRVALNIELKVVDEHGVSCPTGTIGEVVSRGDHTMVGFWNDPDRTRSRKIDGWVHLGDLGYFDEDGYLYLVDRKEDMIITGGFNVWPAEIEEVLYDHPAVKEAAVFGVEDSKWGEAVNAVVVLRDAQDASPEALQRFLAERLVKYKVPKRVFLRTEPLPKSGIGKLLRRRVREETFGELAETTATQQPGR